MTTRRRSALLLPLLAITTPLLTGGICGPSAPSVETDTCDNPVSAAISQIEIGHLSSGSTNANAFIPYKDGELIPVEFGGQGSSMIVLRLRFTGASGGCVAQQLTVTGDLGARISGYSLPVVTDQDAQGRAVSHEIYLPGRYWRVYSVNVTAGGASASGTYESGRYDNCKVSALCESNCLTVQSCTLDECQPVAPQRRSAMEAVRECLHRVCGLTYSGMADAGAESPDGGTSSVPCTNGQYAKDCQTCAVNAVIPPEECSPSQTCGACGTEVSACDAIP